MTATSPVTQETAATARPSDAAELFLPDGAAVRVPPGAVVTATDVVLSALETVPPLPEPSWSAVGSAYAFVAEGDGTFARPVTLSIPYRESDLPADFAEEDLFLVTEIEGDWIPVFGAVDADRNTITVETLQNGVWLVVGLGVVLASLSDPDVRAEWVNVVGDGLGWLQDRLDQCDAYTVTRTEEEAIQLVLDRWDELQEDYAKAGFTLSAAELIVEGGAASTPVRALLYVPETELYLPARLALELGLDPFRPVLSYGSSPALIARAKKANVVIAVVQGLSEVAALAVTAKTYLSLYRYQEADAILWLRTHPDARVLPPRVEDAIGRCVGAYPDPNDDFEDLAGGTVDPEPPEEPIAAPYIDQIGERLGGGIIPNGCGREGGLDVPDAPLLSWIAAFGTADSFRTACNAHDVCYGQNQGKQRCDQEFIDALVSACDTRSSDPTCRLVARVYHAAVTVFGHRAYLEPPAWEQQGETLDAMDRLEPDGRLVSVQRAARFDEVIVVALIENVGGSGEFRVRLLTADGSTVDVEPDTFWKDLLPGQRHVLYLSSEWDPLWDVFNLGAELTVALVEDSGKVHDQTTIATPRPSGEISNVAARRIPNLITDDEFEACVTFANAGETIGEFRLALLASDGTLINKEPDTFWRNLSPGEQDYICLSTEFTFDSIGDLGSSYAVVLEEQHLGEMDRVTGSTP